MKSFARILRCCVVVGISAALAAQGVSVTSSKGVPILVRQHAVTLDALQRGANLGVPGYVVESLWLGAYNYAVGERTVDLARNEVLEVSRERIRFRTMDDRELWSVARALVRVQARSASTHRLLFDTRIVLPRAGGGLVALHRTTGAVAWEQPDAPSECFAHDAELVFVAGGDKKSPTLAAFAWRNGARAFLTPLQNRAVRIVPGEYGVAVLHDGGAVVFDRAGPKLFNVATPLLDLHPVPQAAVHKGHDAKRSVAWYARSKDAVHAWDSMGVEQWGVPMIRNDVECLSVTATGDLVVAEYCNFSDSGFTATCFDRSSGDVLWRRRQPGLMVDHSKYRHRLYVQPVGERLLFVSQASAGDFVVALRSADGGQLGREEWPRR